MIWPDGKVNDCHSAWDLITGTYGQGAVNTTYARLVALFGNPDEGDGLKTQAEWIIATPAGIATIYDWKQGACYHGKEDGIPVEDVVEWSIGGHNPQVVEWIERAVKN